MPQMAPMNWLVLFILFSIVFLFFFMNNFYFNYNKISLEQKSFKKNMINWQW